MRQRDAILRAQQRARATRQWRYVVWSVEDIDAPGQHYHVATDTDADTDYAGAEVVVTVGPDGTIEP